MTTRHRSVMAHLFNVGSRYVRQLNQSGEGKAILKGAAAHIPANECATYRDLIVGYNFLKHGRASTADIDDLRERARLFLKVYRDQHSHVLQEVKALLGWLDYARTIGRVRITVRQLRERKHWGSWTIDCGIDASGYSTQVTKSVKGNMGVDGCVLEIPWDPDGSIKVWMHLTDSGYETCWGHFGPIGMSSTIVLQEQAGLLRELYADQFDKDFKLCFTIWRNFKALPVLSGFPSPALLRDGGTVLSSTCGLTQ